MRIDIYDDSKNINFNDLPEVVQEYIKTTDYEELTEEEKDEYRDNEYIELKYIKYPQNFPIITSTFEIDGGFGIRQFYKFIHNLKETFSIDLHITNAIHWEKENEDDAAYIVIEIKNSDFHWFLIIEF